MCGSGNGTLDQSRAEVVDKWHGPCVINLSLNDLRRVERHAFAWIKYLDVVLGDGRLPLSIDAYAFSGLSGHSHVCSATSGQSVSPPNLRNK